LLTDHAIPDAAAKWIEKLQIGNEKAFYGTDQGAAYNADSLEMLKKLPSKSVDLVMTSPPFALLRKKEYGNEPVDRYLNWFMPFCARGYRVLPYAASITLSLQCDLQKSFTLPRNSTGTTRPSYRHRRSGSPSAVSASRMRST